MSWFTNDVTIGILTWIGTILGFVALYFTIDQAKSAVTASNAAKEAVKSVRAKISLGNIAFSYSLIQRLKLSLEAGGNFQELQLLHHSLSRNVEEAVSSLSFRDDLVGEIQGVKRSLKAVQTQIDLALMGKFRFKPGIAVRALSGISAFLVSREQELKQ